MKATNTNRKNTFNPNHRKENRFFKQMTAVVFTENKFREVATLRYYSTDSRTYCCFWGWDTSGTGSAGGYGYDRPSAAAAEAIANAGIDLSEPIDGRGDCVVRSALEAIAEMYFPNAPHYVSEAYA